MEDDKTSLVRVFTGSEITVNLLKSEMEKAGISAMMQSDQNTGVSSGFYGSFPSDFELYIQDEDMHRAERILKDFIKLNK